MFVCYYDRRCFRVSWRFLVCLLILHKRSLSSSYIYEVVVSCNDFLSLVTRFVVRCSIEIFK
ncbi:hypothetical protein K661_00386 [Piscirickettsia salmonis LF-89 = ATCC VR-1361]|nr:hypothetical protein K661_00386 [Piscirickettsia salmonis LF-89 = ATCC VR-1361]